MNVLSHVWRGVCLSAEGVVYLIMCISFGNAHVVLWCGVCCVVYFITYMSFVTPHVV